MHLAIFSIRITNYYLILSKILYNTIGDIMLKEKSMKILEFLNPDYIYIPIEDNFKITNNYIYKLQLINNIYSSISGNITSYKYMLNIKNEKIKCLTIKNDYLEKVKYQSKYSETKIKFKNKSLIIDAFDLEPKSTFRELLLMTYVEEILQTIDYLIDKYNLETAKIILKDKKNSKIHNYIGTYPNIKLSDYTNVESISVSRIYDIHKFLKYKKPVTTKLINIITSKNNLYIKVKIGCSLKEILKKFNLYNEIEETNLLIINNCINGSNVLSDDLIITKDIDVIIFIKNNFTKTKECIECGKCSGICPVNLIPSYIMKYSNNKTKLKLLKPQRCIGCGLCSYICPSKIELMEHVILAKEKVIK